MTSRLSDARLAKTIVLDANILIRAVLGTRVFGLLHRYLSRVRFVAPQLAFDDARTYVPGILASRGTSPDTSAVARRNLARLPTLVASIADDAYAESEAEARLRLKGRDEDDWPYVALALSLGCPIWIEDQDFFGSGVATRTTDRVEVYSSA